MGPADAVEVGVSALRRAPEYTQRPGKNNSFEDLARNPVLLAQHVCVMRYVARDYVG